MKLRLTIAIAVLAAVGVAMAGDVYDRSTATVSTTGSGTFTNNQLYASLELKRIWLEAASATNQTVAINRVTADGTYTQTVGSVAIGASTSGSTASFTAAYLKYNDKLTFTSTGGIAATGGVAVIEYVVSKH